MKLLCVIPAYWPAFQYGGPMVSTHLLNRALAKKGVEVTVYTTAAGLKNTVEVNREVIVDQVKVSYFSFSKVFEFIGTAGWQLSLRLDSALKSNLKYFDLVYIAPVWNYPTAVAAYYCLKYKKPYIISPRGSLYPYTYAKKRAWLKQLYYRMFIRRNIGGAAAIHYTSDNEAQECRSFLGLNSKEIILPNGIDLSEFGHLPDRENFRVRYPVLKGKKVIIFLGRINWKKGLDILIKAYYRLAKERNDAHLLIAGGDDGGYGKVVSKWVDDYGIRERVTFTGLLTPEDKIEAYAASDVFVLPSYSENFGMSVIEAMACGVPVVVSNKVGISGDIRQSKAGIVVDCNEGSLYEGMVSVLDSEDLARELSFNARKMVEECYNIDNIADKMILEFQAILNRA